MGVVARWVFGAALAVGSCACDDAASSGDAGDSMAAVIEDDAATGSEGQSVAADGGGAAGGGSADASQDAARPDAPFDASLWDAAAPESDAATEGGRVPDASGADAVSDAQGPDAEVEAAAGDAATLDGAVPERDESRLALYDGFENAALGSAWRTQGCEDWSIEVATEGYRGAPRASAGERMLRFETRPGDRKPVQCAAGSAGHRAEIHLEDRFAVGSDLWVGFRLYLPEGFDLVGKTYVMQIHGHEPGSNGGCEGVDRVTPMTWLRIEDGRAAFVYGQHARRGDVGDWALGTSDLGRWHDVVVHYLPSPDATGRLEVWWDGTRTVDDRGLNMCPAARPYLKLGLYQNDHNVAYYDEVRVGTPSASYADVAP